MRRDYGHLGYRGSTSTSRCAPTTHTVATVGYPSDRRDFGRRQYYHPPVSLRFSACSGTSIDGVAPVAVDSAGGQSGSPLYSPWTGNVHAVLVAGDARTTFVRTINDWVLANIAMHVV